MKSKGYLAFGGNLGDTRWLFRTALRRLKRVPLSNILAVADLYQTSPVHCWTRSLFLNTVCAFSTELSLDAWMEEVEHIERALGKLPKSKQAPRPIDLDLLFWNQERRTEGRFQIPHPSWQTRAFVVRPLMDLTTYVEVELPSGLGVEKIALKPLLEKLSLENHLVRKVAW